MSTETDLIRSRLDLLEEVVNKIQVALTNVASTEAVRQIILLTQTDIQDIQTNLEQLSSKVDLIEAEVFS